MLAHEETHARHFDPLWSLLRVVCLAVYWFHPLVWAAAAASKTDCELACDEAVLARLNAEERIAYGRTLLALIPVRRGPSSPCSPPPP
ncbi:MAG: M56 family metallopeptidase [Oscillospiraceae bacterium]